ncbi:hypothetical protein AOLI_G00030710 [Acnodon oligacanthus]
MVGETPKVFALKLVLPPSGTAAARAASQITRPASLTRDDGARERRKPTAERPGAARHTWPAALHRSQVTVKRGGAREEQPQERGTAASASRVEEAERDRWPELS